MLNNAAIFIIKFINTWHMFWLIGLVVAIHLCRAALPRVTNGYFGTLSERGRAINWAALGLAYLWIGLFDVPPLYMQAGFRVVMFLFVLSEIVYNWSIVKVLCGGVTKWMSSKVSRLKS